MPDTILTTDIQAQLRDFFTQYEFYNPGVGFENETKLAIDAGVLLHIQAGERRSFPDETVYGLELRLFFTDSEMKPAEDEKFLHEVNEYGETLQTELEDTITEFFGAYRDLSSLPEFLYRGDWRDGHCYTALFDIPDDALAPTPTDSVDVTLTVTETVTQTIPATVADEGEEAIRDYLVTNWWSTLSRSDKASLLNVVGAVIATGDETYQDILAEGATEFQIECD